MKAGTIIDNDFGRVLRRVNTNTTPDLRKSIDLLEEATQRDFFSPSHSQMDAPTQTDFKDFDNESRNVLIRASTVLDALTQTSQNSQDEIVEETKTRKRELETSRSSQSSENPLGILESLLPEICDVYIIPGRDITIGRKPSSTIT